MEVAFLGGGSLNYPWKCMNAILDGKKRIFRLVYSKRKENCHIVLAFKPPLVFPTTFCASKLTRISPFSFSKTSGGRGQNLLFEFAYVLLLCWLGSPMNYFI